MLVAGLVMNMGKDRKADGLTTFFCGDPMVRELIDEYGVDLRELADFILTAVK
jgi:hypothetical protein